MDVRKRAWIGLCAAMMLVGMAGTAEAFYIDEKNTLSFSCQTVRPGRPFACRIRPDGHSRM